ncbi:hypothetical protein [Nocardia sp. CA-119907]|uniref:hypothetical protein n=1 Tax=Nocardia sp. CA-119907 TaxID=3239973 RepID=UPI003D96D779
MKALVDGAARRRVEHCVVELGTLLDPACGSGTLLVEAEELDELAEAASDAPARGPNSKGNFEREVDAGKAIGSVSEQLGGHATTRYKIITDRFGGIITMYPIP